MQRLNFQSSYSKYVALRKLNYSHLLEAVVWTIIASVFFVYSFEFNQPIEIYKFGATAWPRSILFMLALVVVGNLFYQRANGSNPQPGRVGITEDDLSDTSKPFSSFLNVGAFLFVSKIGINEADMITDIKIKGSKFSGLLKLRKNIPNPILP